MSNNRNKIVRERQGIQSPATEVEQAEAQVSAGDAADTGDTDQPAPPIPPAPQEPSPPIPPAPQPVLASVTHVDTEAPVGAAVAQEPVRSSAAPAVDLRYLDASTIEQIDALTAAAGEDPVIAEVVETIYAYAVAMSGRAGVDDATLRAQQTAIIRAISRALTNRGENYAVGLRIVLAAFADRHPESAFSDARICRGLVAHPEGAGYSHILTTLHTLASAGSDIGIVARQTNLEIGFGNITGAADRERLKATLSL